MSRAIIFVIPSLSVGGVEAFTLSLLADYKVRGVSTYVVATPPTSTTGTSLWSDKFTALSTGVLTWPGQPVPSRCADLVSFIYKCSQHYDNLTICGMHSLLFYKALPDIRRYTLTIRCVSVLHNNAAEGPIALDAKADVAVHVCITDSVANSLKDLGVPAQEVCTIYNGIDTSRFISAPKTNSDIVVSWLGRLAEEKRPMEFIEIAKRLASIPNLYFQIGGAGYMQEKVQAEIARIRLPRLKFLGLVDSAEVLKNSDILCLTSRVEGFPLVALEALSANNAVVSTRVGEVPSLFQNERYGLLANVGDTAKMIEHVRFLATHRDVLATKKALGHTYIVDNYSLGKMTEKYYEVLCPTT